jgi:hypothetical protein
VLGKWINRDPTTDQIVLNLYLFCHNNPLNRFDFDGRTDIAMLLTGVANVVAGSALFALLFAGDAATGFVGTAVFGIGLVGSAIEVGAGLDQIGEALLTAGPIMSSGVSPDRGYAFDLPTSTGGALGRLIGGKDGQDLGDFLDASAGLMKGSADLGVSALNRLVEWNVVLNVETWALSGLGGAGYFDSDGD